ncbi:hypothetical protein [Pseudomonas soli]|uniref:hypothetical protein n=1 Tax=Pseudomonas soli TaxID=1306993 RepID=UPI0028AA22D7|nr:hypothetical protein [Pseudomonas soli]
MQASTPSSSGSKATTTPRHLQATAIVGGALIGFLVMKTREARRQLESVTNTAHLQGDLSAQDADLVHQLLAASPRTNLI